MKTSIKDESYAPHVALILVQLLFGSFPVVGKFVLLTFPPLGIVAFRISGAAVLLYFVQRFSGRLALDKKSDYPRLAFYSLIGVLLNQILYVTGLSLTKATNTALLAVLIPVFAVIISTVFKYERFTWLKAAGIILAALGVVYLIDPSKASFSSQTTQGDMLIVLNSFFYAWYVSISKDTFARNGALRSIVWIMIFGAMMCLPIGAYAMKDLDFSSVSASAWLAIAFIIIFPTAGAYFFNAWAVARVQASTVVVYVYLQPLIGAFLALTWLGEAWNPRVLPAMALIFAGVYLVTKRQRKTVPENI
ncbi:MAG TPA: DMT family transporter [Pyrinomonadaceae bacterium]|jgi:drug/metabolite transporter (DMT)-like permease|nr:DMT family transporter [Pyrinomonadaceae bacterium]